MLEKVMRFVNNRFDRDGDGIAIGSLYGEFQASGGTMAVPGLKDGQWFWIECSSLNDGLHQYPADDLEDETFEGRVVFLRVPRAFQELCADIEAWTAENAKALDGPYDSESFGGYSYNKARGGSQGNETALDGWKLHFAAELRPYRKLSRDWV